MAYHLEIQPLTDKRADLRGLSDLIHMESADAVMDEIRIILKRISPKFMDTMTVSAFTLTADLYNGHYPGYRACNTEYHDFHHAIHTFLAMARLIHGAVIDGKSFRDKEITLGLTAALFHDAGYIQKKNDTKGTGAKYTANHVKRSMAFFESFGKEYGLTDNDITCGRSMILCTDLEVDISKIHFSSKKIAFLGKMLGTADLLAQMSDRNYLEKLLYLYREFKEAQIGNYRSEIDLLNNAFRFYDDSAKRMATSLDKTNRFMAIHFASRWGIMGDLYKEALENQRKYLNQILNEQGSDPRDYLKRNGIVDRIRKKYHHGLSHKVISAYRSFNTRLRAIPQSIS